MTTTATIREVRTIAQALRRIKDLKGALARCDERMMGSARWEAENEPAYKFDALNTERVELEGQIVSLRTRIAVANATTSVRMGDKSILLAGAVHRQAEIKGRIALLNRLPVQVRHEMERSDSQRVYDEATGRYLVEKTSTTTCVAMTERERAEKVEELQQELRDLDEALQEANHRTELPAE